MNGSTNLLLRRFLAGSGASAGIEAGLGAVALLAVSILCFDVYSVARVDTAGGRSAVAMADYVSREIVPDGDAMAAFGQFLYQREFDAPASLVYVVSAINRPVGEDQAALLWSDNTIRFGDATVTDELATECGRRATQGWRTVLLGTSATFDMEEGEISVIAETCSRPSRQGLLTNLLVAGDSYHMHVLPARDRSQPPSAPAYAPP